jgi:hypothetical protein
MTMQEIELEEYQEAGEVLSLSATKTNTKKFLTPISSKIKFKSRKII